MTAIRCRTFDHVAIFLKNHDYSDKNILVIGASSSAEISAFQSAMPSHKKIVFVDKSPDDDVRNRDDFLACNVKDLPSEYAKKFQDDFLKNLDCVIMACSTPNMISELYSHISSFDIRCDIIMDFMRLKSDMSDMSIGSNIDIGLANKHHLYNNHILCGACDVTCDIYKHDTVEEYIECKSVKLYCLILKRDNAKLYDAISHTALGINIDHVATLRNARGGCHPEPVEAARSVEKSGANILTFHLREDRRHIRDADVHAIKSAVGMPINFEMAATREMREIALELSPKYVCLVPEKREELTTEGGLDVIKNAEKLREFIKPLHEEKILISCFIDANTAQIDAVKGIGADIVEIHTGPFADSMDDGELHKVLEAILHANTAGLECHIGHGLGYDSLEKILKKAGDLRIDAVHVGHFAIGEAVFCGLAPVIEKFLGIIENNC